MSYNMPIVAPRTGTEKELRSRMPRIQTSPSDERAATSTGTQSMKLNAPATPSIKEAATKSPTAPGGHQRFVLTDHVAFRYLEEDPSTTVLARRQRLEGYEMYLVEQWACSRTHPTFVINTYTGDPKDTVQGNVISVPTDETAWSPALKLYFKALDEYHARRKETSLGTLMITNLNGFPSSLTVIPVPEGDMKKYREIFFVNEDLKRLGCSGRLGINILQPSGATMAKFHQLYRTSDKIPFNSSVIELVKLCQVALVLFGILEPEYADGLLCDVTEEAVKDWWVEFGAEYYTVEPHDGILGPTTVAALLGMLIGARNRLSAYNAPVSKDVFDIESTKRGIAYFQKSQHLNKSRRLDRQTLERLRRATAKAASKEGWTMPRALKSTVAELGGKGGEMVMGMVGAGEKAGIAEVETVDIDRFVELVHGERAKWLWQGKPRKTATGDMFSRLPNEEDVSPVEQQAQTSRLLKRESTLEGTSLGRRETSNDDSKRSYDALGNVESNEKDPFSKRAAFKRATTKIESGSGLNRIKDAVGRRNHQSKPSKEENGRIPALHRSRSDVGSPRLEKPNGFVDTRPKYAEDPMSYTSSITSPGPTSSHETDVAKRLSETPAESAATLVVEDYSHTHPEVDGQRESNTTLKPPSVEDEDYASSRQQSPTLDPSVAGSIYRGLDQETRIPFDEADTTNVLLRRTQSSDQLASYHASRRHESWWPRHLSFSIAEENVLTWRPIAPRPDSEVDLSDLSLESSLAQQRFLSKDTKRLRHRLDELSTIDATWVSHRLSSIRSLEAQADQDITSLEDLYFPRFDSYQLLREDAHEIISQERAQLQDGIRDLETLGAKLEYEINALRSKVEDMEDGVGELERQVVGVEGRVRELESVLAEREGWGRWVFRVLTGIG
ncbi:hypothetical protein P154DRAFT_455530, partial [Amniculicola lignicola CBS 123094]